MTPGYSGGPVFDEDSGCAVGVIQSKSGSKEGYAIRWKNISKKLSLLGIKINERVFDQSCCETRDRKTDIQKIPSRFLPYLIDRYEQLYKLKSMAQKCTKTESQHPLTRIIHGEEGQALNMFLECHIPYYWPKIQPSRSEQAGPIRIEFDWPRYTYNNIELKQEIIREIYHKVQDSFSCDYKKISGAINKRYIGRPILMCTFVYTDDWEICGKEIISNFREFWRDWPPRPKGDILIACLVIKYLKDETNLFKKLLKPFVKIGAKYARINDEIRQTLKSGYANFEIPELQGIKRRDVYEWARLKEVKKICEQKNLSPETIIPEIYESVNIGDRIPMETLAQELNKRIFRRESE